MVLEIGDQIDQRYRVTELLGQGGMGEVWAAVSEQDGREVALKVLKERAARKADIVARFKREARIAEHLRSPFVCSLLDTAYTSTGSLVLVFERLRGESLSDRLKRENFLPFSEMFGLVDDMWQGLADAHAASVLHRDLKPGNIFITCHEDGSERAVMLDFGVSKLLNVAREENENTLTAIDGTVGSFAYMAPEQVRGAARVDERADIYGVGAVAFRALTGRLPFEGMTARMVVSLKLGHPPPSLEETTGVRWPRVMEQYFTQTLARVPAHRFESAAVALTRWRELAEMVEHARVSAVRKSRLLEADGLDG